MNDNNGKLKTWFFIALALGFLVFFYGPIFVYGMYMADDDLAEIGL